MTPTMIVLSKSLHALKPNKKTTLCGVWLHPTFWRLTQNRVAILACQECKAALAADELVD